MAPAFVVMCMYIQNEPPVALDVHIILVLTCGLLTMKPL